MVFCSTHKEAQAVFHCSICELAFCKSCTLVKEINRIEISLCPQCEKPLNTVKGREPALPAHEQIKNTLEFPFRDFGLALLLGWMVFAILVRGFPVYASSGWEEAIRLANGPFFFIYFVCVVIIFYQITGDAAMGTFDLHTYTYRSFFKRAFSGENLYKFIPFAAFLVPIVIVYTFYVDVHTSYQQSPSSFKLILVYILLGLVWVAILLGLFILPMTFLAVGIIKNTRFIFNPLNIIKQIRKVRKDYSYFILSLVCSIIAYALFRHLWRSFLFNKSAFAYVAFFFIDSGIHIYLILIFGQFLGFVHYRNRHKLKWLHATAGEPDEIVVKETEAELVPLEKAKPDTGLAGKIKRATYFMDHGNYEDAATLFDNILDEEPDNIDVVRGRVMVAFRQDDRETINECGKKIAAHFVADDAFEPLWDMYQRYRKTIEDFVFEPLDMKALSTWLNENGLHLDAARVLRELAVAYPDADDAPEVFYDCAMLLADRCEKVDTAISILNSILERYPESEFASKAEVSLSELKTEE